MSDKQVCCDWHDGTLHLILPELPERIEVTLPDSRGREVYSARAWRFEQIVRCRDCEHYEKDPEPIDPGWPMMCERTGADMVEPDGFCAWGVRRADA